DHLRHASSFDRGTALAAAAAATTPPATAFLAILGGCTGGMLALGEHAGRLDPRFDGRLAFTWRTRRALALHARWPGLAPFARLASFAGLTTLTWLARLTRLARLPCIVAPRLARA